MRVVGLDAPVMKLQSQQYDSSSRRNFVSAATSFSGSGLCAREGWVTKLNDVGASTPKPPVLYLALAPQT
jgi:hypothetical protein